jgi:hypothetical protein
MNSDLIYDIISMHAYVKVYISTLYAQYILFAVRVLDAFMVKYIFLV